MDFFGAGARWLKRVCLEEKSKKKQRKEKEIFDSNKTNKKKKNQQKRNDRNEKLTKHFPFFYYATHTLLLNNNNRHRQHEQHGGHPRIGRREDAVLHLERREQQRHLSKPSQGGGRRVRESLGFTKEGVSESFGRAQSWTRRESEEVERFWFCVLREREREID